METRNISVASAQDVEIVACKYDSSYGCPVNGQCYLSGCMLVADGDGVAVERWFK